MGRHDEHRYVCSTCTIDIERVLVAAKVFTKFSAFTTHHTLPHSLEKSLAFQMIIYK